MKYYMVPEKDLENLEKARLSLIELTENDIIFLEVRQHMWQLTFRKYPVVYFSKLINKLSKRNIWSKRHD